MVSSSLCRHLRPPIIGPRAQPKNTNKLQIASIGFIFSFGTIITRLDIEHGTISAVLIPLKTVAIIASVPEFPIENNIHPMKLNAIAE